MKQKFTGLISDQPPAAGGDTVNTPEHRKAEEKLRRSEARFRLLADSAGRLLATPDPQTVVRQLCREVLEFLDCQFFFNFLADERDSSPESVNLPRLRLNAWAGIPDGEARRLEWLDYGAAVCGCVARDGRPIIARSVQESDDPRTALVKSYGIQAYCCHPLLSDGRIIGTLGFGTKTRSSFTADEIELMRAIADQVSVAMRRLQTLKALETARGEALKEKNRLAVVMETLPVGVCIQDAQGAILRTNAAYRELWGGPLPPVRGVSDYAAYKACWAATKKPVEPEEWASARALKHGETVLNQELQIERFDGTQAYVLNSAAPICDPDGRIIGCAVGIRDITHHKQAEELTRQLEVQVQQAQKEESLVEMAGGIAHDFNNLLSVIVGNIGLVSAELPEDSASRPLLAMAEEASRRAAGLCQQMLAYVGKTPLSFGSVQLNDLLKETAHLIAASLPKNVQLQWQLPEQLPLINADSSQLRQVIVNLLINASEAIGDHPGQITVTTGFASRRTTDLQSTWVQEPLPAGNYVFLEVADTGCGMEASLLARVFDPFFSTKFTGRGLGLSAALGIVRSHHGTIQVQSVPGRGSAFRIWLPAIIGEVAPISRQPSQPAREWRGSGTVLLVDDEDAIRSTTKAMLELLGFDVITAGDGLDALEIYRTGPKRFWCVLLDATMPRFGGEATFRELVRIREDVRVVLSSGYSKHDIMARFAGRGLSGFLQKPYSVQDLSAVLQSLAAEPTLSPEHRAQVD